MDVVVRSIAAVRRAMGAIAWGVVMSADFRSTAATWRSKDAIARGSR